MYNSRWVLIFVGGKVESGTAETAEAALDEVRECIERNRVTYRPLLHHISCSNGSGSQTIIMEEMCGVHILMSEDGTMLTG